jgi:ABC-type multidrug transport system fused ATPase/permease subunit
MKLKNIKILRLIFKESPLKQVLFLLSKEDQIKLLGITGVQIWLGFLDLIGVFTIGALGALAVQGVEAHGPGNKVSFVLRTLRMQNLSLQAQVACLGISAAAILMIKTVSSIFFTRRIFFFLSHKGAEVSSNLMSKVLSLGILEVQKRPSQEIVYIVSEGVTSLMIGILATTLNIVADMFLLILIALGLFYVDFGVALSTILIFSITGFVLHKQLSVKSNLLGIQANELIVENNQKSLEVLNAYRETIVRHRRGFYIDEIRALRYKIANVIAEISFMPFTSKYVIESVSVLGSLFLAGYELGTKNAVHAVATLAVFLSASSRIAPAALRIQQGFLLIRRSQGASNSTLDLIKELRNLEAPEELNIPINFNYLDFVPTLEINNINFKYSESSTFTLSDISLRVEEGTSVAIVGPSGSGKSTLVDLILGVLEPDSGKILISGYPPNRASELWPGGISYVPQSIAILSGSVRENVGQGFPIEYATNEKVMEALRQAQLSELVEQLPNGLDFPVGEFGSNLSGGQRQRLGIARALFTSPKLLVLDEATSALDGQTEDDLSNAISALSGKTTLIIVAHRLSTIKTANQIVYLKSGKILANGSYEEVRQKVPEFEREALKLR